MSGVTFGAPLLYVEGNVDSSNIDDYNRIQKKKENLLKIIEVLFLKGGRIMYTPIFIIILIVLFSETIRTNNKI